jgi:N-acetylmuramoyl-L-alanine amidase CwlA
MTYANDPNYYFKDAALNNAVDLVKYLMDKYNIDVNHVIRHYDVNGK